MAMMSLKKTTFGIDDPIPTKALSVRIRDQNASRLINTAENTVEA
jgi:hypothetical protein